MGPLVSRGGFSACSECHALIDMNNYKALTTRSLDAFPSHMHRALVPGVLMVHALFRKHRTGVAIKV
jgi:hypothetical protein